MSTPSLTPRQKESMKLYSEYALDRPRRRKRGRAPSTFTTSPVKRFCRHDRLYPEQPLQETTGAIWDKLLREIEDKHSKHIPLKALLSPSGTTSTSYEKITRLFKDIKVTQKTKWTSQLSIGYSRRILEQNLFHSEYLVIENVGVFSKKEIEALPRLDITLPSVISTHIIALYEKHKEDLGKITKLSLEGKGITYFPSRIVPYLSKLGELNLRANHLFFLSHSLYRSCIQILNLSGNNIRHICQPPFLRLFKHPDLFKHLDLSNNKMTTFNFSLKNFRFDVLNLGYNPLVSICDNFDPDVDVLYLNDTKLTRFPVYFAGRGLKYLYLKNTPLEGFPKAFTPSYLHIHTKNPKLLVHRGRNFYKLKSSIHSENKFYLAHETRMHFTRAATS